MPRIENIITHRPITRTTSPDVARHPYRKGETCAAQSGPTLTLRDVRMPRKGNLDDVRADEPTVMDAYQRSVLADIKAIKTLDKFANSRLAPSLRPRLIRPAIAPIATVSDAGEPTKAIEAPKATRTPSIYDRHGLTSRGRKLSGDIGARLRAELAETVQTNPLIRTYPALRAK